MTWSMTPLGRTGFMLTSRDLVRCRRKSRGWVPSVSSTANFDELPWNARRMWRSNDSAGAWMEFHQPILQEFYDDSNGLSMVFKMFSMPPISVSSWFRNSGTWSNSIPNSKPSFLMFFKDSPIFYPISEFLSIHKKIFTPSISEAWWQFSGLRLSSLRRGGVGGSGHRGGACSHIR